MIDLKNGFLILPGCKLMVPSTVLIKLYCPAAYSEPKEVGGLERNEFRTPRFGMHNGSGK
jgi:hypothetical protein